MSNTELSTIQKAITDIKVLADLEPKMFFTDYCSEIVEALKIMNYNEVDITFDNLRSHINQGKLKYKRSVLDKILEIESGAFGWVEDFIKDIQDKYFNFHVKQHAQILTKAGTDECTLCDVTFHNDAIKDLCQIGSDITDFQNADALRGEMLNRKEEDLNDARLRLSDPLLKRAFGDYLKPKLYVVSGFPGSGKNMLVDCLVAELIGKHKGAYIPYDNSRQETMTALMCSLTNIPFDNIENNNLSDDQKVLIDMHREKLKNLYIAKKHYAGNQIQYMIEKLVKECGVEFLVLDYFQKIPVPNDKQGTQHRENNVRMFTELNADLNIPTIVISQLNKDGKQKWCEALYEQSYMVIKIYKQGDDDEYLRTVNVERNKKGGEPTFNVNIDGSKGVIREVEYGY